MITLLYAILNDVSAARQKVYQAKYKAPIVVPGDIQITQEIQKLQGQLR